MAINDTDRDISSEYNESFLLRAVVSIIILSLPAKSFSLWLLAPLCPVLGPTAIIAVGSTQIIERDWGGAAGSR